MEHHHHEHTFTTHEELAAFLKYTVTHNHAHFHELEHLAQQLKDAGETEAYEALQAAVESFEEGNHLLAVAEEIMEAK